MKVPFKIENNSRNDDTIIHVAIREALTNTLVHADYNESGSILVEKKNNTKVLSNLVYKNLLTSTGSGRGMKYIINYENNHISQSNIGGNEQKIVEVSRFAQEKRRLETNDMLNIIIELCKVKSLSARELGGNYLNRDYNRIRKEYLSKLVKENKLFLTIPDKQKNSKQKYYSKEI